MRTEKEKYLDGQQIGVINKIHSIHPCSPSMTTIAVAPVRHDESMLPTVRPSSVHVGLPDSRISTTESPSFPTTTSPKSFSDHSHLSSISATANELVPTDAWSSMSEVATPSSAQQETSTSAFAVETTTTASTPKAVSSPTISVVQDAKDSTLSKEASRFGDLERKRMGLVKMRVNLEQKLFEAKSSDESCSSSNKSSDTRESGRGNIIWPDGKSVTGQWHMGQLNGRCFFQWPSGETYDGDCLNGKKHGRGVHTWPDGKVYKGQYENGYEHGFGTLTSADGVSRYRGKFHYGKRHGLGTQIWRDKNYEGEWKDNALCGRGKLSWKNGTKYEGEFLQGRYHGHGIFVDGTTGRKYVGSWVQGQKQGWGKETWPQTGESYEGTYRGGRRNGFGRLTMGDGSLYVGGWFNGERAGCAIHVASNGDVLHCGPLFQTRMASTEAVALSSSQQQQQPLSEMSFSDLTNCVPRNTVSFGDDLDLQSSTRQEQQMLQQRRCHDDGHLLHCVSSSSSSAALSLF